VTTTLLLTALLTATADGEYLSRSLVQLTLAYLTMRGSIPAELAALLQALSAAIAAAGSPLLSLITASSSGCATPCCMHSVSTLHQRCHPCSYVHSPCHEYIER
jgi:ribonuclease PH